MRELKFRVWWKDESDYSIYTEYDLFDDTWTNAEYIAIEQYTGINDKNCKEIYDGDIIQENLSFDIDSLDGIFKYKVYWNEEMLCWGLEHIGNESIHDDLWECNSSIEVIGNIHQNPDLLKDKS